MKYETITIANLFPDNDFREKRIKQIEIHEKIADLRNKVNKKESRLKWSKVFEEILNTGNKFLSISLKDVLERAWENYDEIKKYLDSDDYNSDETFLIPLARHTVVSDHHPAIEIKLAETYLGKIDFEIHLELILSGIILKISQGKIQGVKTGKCQSKGYFSCEGISLFQDESNEFEF
jgi:hypothetical protein